MAELNLNYDPAWLQQRPDSNQPMSLAEAFQLKQRQQQLDTEKALLPLRQQEMQANLASAALDMKIKQEQMDTFLKAKATDAAVWEQAAKVNDWLDPAQVTPIYEAIAKAGGGVSRETLGFVEKSVQGAQTYSARLINAETRLEGIQDTLRTRQAISDSVIQAAKERTDAAISSRELIAKDNREARAELQLLRENRKLLNIGKQVTWPEFLNRTMGTYVRNTGKTPEEAAPALRKIYDDYIAIPDGESTAPANPKDPASLFTP